MMLTGKRMVFASEFHPGGTAQGLAHGFHELGWAVHEVEFRQFFPRLPSRAARLLIKPLQPQFRASYNEGILAAARMVEPQVFVTVKGSMITRETLEELRRMRVGTVMYYPDYNFAFADVDQASFEDYDLFVTSKSFQVDYLKRRLGADRVAFVHHGYCDLTHRPAHDPIAPVTDVLYVGNYSPEKERWLSALKRLVPEIDLRIVGFRWEVAKDAALRPHVHGHGLVGDNYARAIQLARINIALHGDRKEPEGWQDLVSTRTFEIPACKGFMLHIDNTEIRTLFEPDTEIGVFATPEELAQSVRRYLAEPELRRAMTERAFARAVPAYGYAARAGSLDALIAKRLGFQA